MIDPRAQTIDLDRQDCEESFYEFYRHAWSILDSQPWKDGWVIEVICEHLEAVVDGEIQNLLINLPPRCGKSSICSVCFPAWVWTQQRISPTSGPGVPFLHASYAEALAIRDSVRCRRLIESPWYQERWGRRYQLTSDQNTKSRFQNSKGGERFITSVEKRVTGEGGNIIVIDDPNASNEVNAEAAKIQETLDWWNETMSTRLNDQETSAFVVIQQRLAENDLSGHILETEVDDWVHLMLPLEYEPERSFSTSIGWKDPRTQVGEILWPERFSERSIKTMKKRLGSFGAAGQLQQRPEPPGGGIIKRAWWKLWEEPAFPPMDFIIGLVDTAYTEKTQNDPSGMIIFGVFSAKTTAQINRVIGPDGNVSLQGERQETEGAPRVMLMDAWTERLEFNELVKKVHATASRKEYAIDMLLIENKAAGYSIAQELRRLYSHERYSVVMYDPKSVDKLSRLYSVQPIFEDGIVYAPNTVWAESVIQQVGVFPRGKHDEYVDCVSMGLRKLREMGLIMRFEERVAEIEEEMVRARTHNRIQRLYPA